MKYDYQSKSVDPRYGVTKNMSRNFSEASAGVFAWFTDLEPAVLFVECMMSRQLKLGIPNELFVNLHIWDLNNGVECLEWAAVAS